ncbi:hypothetical protein WN982_14545 [Paraburkholderia sp. IMGN_8]|uniref:hypothetical protein n=1 Tax=Paraburkholderia sp. IMGN_8 TaxID=3136564 RepID=UPI003100AE40
MKTVQWPDQMLPWCWSLRATLRHRETESPAALLPEPAHILPRALVRAPDALVHRDDAGETSKFDIASGNVAPDRTIGIVQT